MRSVLMNLTPATGKRLIAKGLLSNPDLRTALESQTVIIVAGTTNAYVAQEVLCYLGQEEGFEAHRFFRGILRPAAKWGKSDFLGDVVIRAGKWQKGLTIHDVSAELTQKDWVFKGANAVHLPSGESGVWIGNPTGGTLTDITAAVIGRRVTLITPVGVEKSVPQRITDYMADLNAPGTQGLRMCLSPGRTYTELDALTELVPGLSVRLVACGGVQGYEGSASFLCEGSEENMDALKRVMQEVRSCPELTFGEQSKA